MGRPRFEHHRSTLKHKQISSLLLHTSSFPFSQSLKQLTAARFRKLETGRVQYHVFEIC